MSTVRCKFICLSKREFKEGYGQNRSLYDYEFTTVYGGDDKASPENKKFWEYTPSGSFKVNTVKDDQFTPGKQYYLDIIEVE